MSGICATAFVGSSRRFRATLRARPTKIWEQQAQTLNLMRAAWKVTTPEEGEKRLEQLARFLERDYESAARSLREGMAEMFTLQRLKLPPSLYKCLATTNLIESPQSGVARGTANVKYWRDHGIVERWLDDHSIRCFSTRESNSQSRRFNDAKT